MSCLCHPSPDALCMRRDIHIVYKWNYFEINLTNYYKYLQTDCNYIALPQIWILLTEWSSVPSLPMLWIHTTSILWIKFIQFDDKYSLALLRFVISQMSVHQWRWLLLVSHSVAFAVSSPQRPIVDVLFGFHCVWLWGIIKANSCDNIS